MVSSCFLVPVMLLQVSFADLDEAILAVERMEPIRGRVSRPVAQEAVEAIRRRPEPPRLEALVVVAREGPHALLAQALLALAVEHDAPAAGAALQVLARERASTPWRETLVEPPQGWRSSLETWLHGDEEAAAQAAAELLVLILPPERLPTNLLDLVEQGRLDRAHRLLALAGPELPRPGEAIGVLLSADVDVRLGATFSDAMARLVARDEAAARTVLEQARQGVWGPAHAVLRSLGQVPPESWEEAQTVVRGFLDQLGAEGGAEDMDPTIARNAILAAGELLMPELVPILPWLALHGPDVAIRRAALVSIGDVCYCDEGTIDLLIDLLDDPVVGPDAHAALLKKAGVQLPKRVEMWDSWRRGRALPKEAPVSDDQRLAEQRKLRALVWQLKRDASSDP